MGGAINGQVVMWNITKALASIDQKKRKQSVRHIGKPGLGLGGEDDEVVSAVPPVKPCAVSHIDMSHRRRVADLVWLPTTTQVKGYGLRGLQRVFGADELVGQDRVPWNRSEVETVEIQQEEVGAAHEGTQHQNQRTEQGSF